MTNDDRPSEDPPLGYEGARRRAEQLAKDPEGTEKLLVRAAEKAERVRDAKKVEGFWNDLMVLFRLIRARLAGRYKITPWRSIVSALAGVVYFVNPLDVVPDVIPFFGFIDDAAVIAFVIRMLMGDLQRFTEWETTQEDESAEAVPVESESRTVSD
jgi:uncharacterized membrane protein YkvA (DUF1232 family)